MPGPAVLTLIGVGALVAALAFYLIYVAVILRRVVGRLEIVLNGVVAVSQQAAPIGEVAGAINHDLAAAQASIEAVAARARQAAEAAALPAAEPTWR
jgi:hypothetical protein